TSSDSATSGQILLVAQLMLRCEDADSRGAAGVARAPAAGAVAPSNAPAVNTAPVAAHNRTYLICPPTSSNPCSDWVMPARLVLVLTREPNLLRLVTQYPWAGQKSRPRTEQGRPVPAVPWWGDTAMVVRAAAAGHAHPGRGGTLSR